VDLAAMRSAVANLKQDPKIIEPLVPVDLVVDHSVQVDFFGSAQALRLNLEMEFKRNRERYKFLKWGQQAFKTFGVVPPGIGIVHQVNLEYLAKGVLSAQTPKGIVYYPDTLVGTDSHTTMINGLGVVGWGVGGIEAEAGMLGQPVYFLTRKSWASTSPAPSRKASPRLTLSCASRNAPQTEGCRKVRRILWRRRGRAFRHRPGHNREYGSRIRRHDGLLWGGRRNSRVSAGHRA
jgi:hypothetical protein